MEKKIPLLTMLDVIIAVCYLGVATEFQKLFFNMFSYVKY